MDVKKFKERILPLSTKMYPLVMRYLGDTNEAEDAIQEIMIKLWRVRNQLNTHPNVNGFALLTAKNYCLDLVKKKKPTMVRDSYELSTLQSVSGHEQFLVEELSNHVLTIIRTLPVQQREVIILRLVDELDYDEISELTQLKVAHIRVLVSRARQTIALALQKTYN
ncbi:RNA polymerase sigma factor [Flavobacteriaceae bacterium F08102]|nr:RNA polymerase sigma factor [Flavobacteriaceae bacterium F08102]